MQSNKNAGTPESRDALARYVPPMKTYTAPVNWESGLHCHAFWEIVVCVKGRNTACHFVNKVRYACNEGDVIVMKPDSRHSTKIGDPASYLHYDLYADLATMKGICDSFDKNRYEQLLSDKSPAVFTLPAAVLPYLESKLALLFSVQNDEQNTALAKTLYLTVLHMISGAMLEEQTKRQNETPAWYLRLLSFMNRPDMLSGSLHDVVNASGFSHGYLCRIFKSYSGERLIEYFTKLKLDYATKLLKNSKHSILDISGMVGYDSLSHFIRIFKKYYLLSPSKYRREILQAPHE
jgi:AraC family cel operon transcriptional repressor